MTKQGIIVLLNILAAAMLLAQTAARPEFEVASIKPSEAIGIHQVRVGVHVDGSEVNCAALSLSNLVEIAYRVKSYQVAGPDFMASERFDINAKLPDGAAEKDVPEMLQALLDDRFRMKLHRESKDLPVYAMVLGKGELKMRESPPDSGTDAPSGGRGAVNVAASGHPGGVSINYGNGSYFTFGDDKLEGHKLTAARTADVLSRFTERPVVDMTGLKGKYDFVLELTPEDFRAMMIRSAINAGVTLPPRAMQYAASASGDSLFSAVEKLGLKLESRKAPLEVLVIDHIEKAPTEN
jgi:uncharacterized protein (TIGR03435 family)